MDGRGQRALRARTSRWLIAGRCCAAIGWLLWVAMQAIAKDPFPPEISISQYGLGGAGWVFTVWAVALAAAPILLLLGAPVPGPALPMLVVGFAGAVVMGVVRTDEGVGLLTWYARVHMMGAVTSLVFLPLGILFALRFADRRTWWIGVGLVVAAGIVGVLVLVSTGVDTVGIGRARSWALWQGILVVIDMLLVTLHAVAAGRITPRMNAVGANG
ncbi:MAG TPA: DUF998 domain-containing protein [Nakamurella sp.]